jgi:hypothetical protein
MAMELIPGPNPVFGTLTANTLTANTVNGATIDNLPWTTWTPVVTASVGTFTATSAVGRYKQIGKTISFGVAVRCITVGSASVAVVFTLPVSANTSVISIASGGREALINGSALNCQINGSTTAFIQYYNTTFPGADGSLLNVSGTYEAL